MKRSSYTGIEDRGILKPVGYRILLAPNTLKALAISHVISYWERYSSRSTVFKAFVPGGIFGGLGGIERSSRRFGKREGRASVGLHQLADDLPPFTFSKLRLHRC